jgi:phosphomannomutase
MRRSSPDLAEAFAQGATEAGADVTLIGLASTDELYFASGHLGSPGAMFTASHNPARYNGIKLCRSHAAPVGTDTGLSEIKHLVASGKLASGKKAGSVEQRDLLDEYAEYLRELVPV